MNHRGYQSAFSLIEIMMVITIISVLSTVMFINFNESREDAKNKSFATNVKEIQLAIEVYKAQNDRYPAAQTSGCGSSFGGFNSADSTNCGANPVVVGLAPDFISEFLDPSDSANSSCHIKYTVTTTGSSYKLTAENCLAGAASSAEGIQPSDELARCQSNCPASGSCDPTAATYYRSFAIYSDGAACQ